MEPLTTAEQVSEIAFGFMGSKALFSVLHFEVFTHLGADGPLPAEQLAAKSGLHTDRAVTLLTALTTLGLVVRQPDGRYVNSPAAGTFLARSGRHDFGDYLRFQIDRQMYPFLEQLDEAIGGTLSDSKVDSYEKWMSDPEEARLYSESQHAGSLSPGRSLARMFDLSSAKTMLDVGGGTGAFSIALCKAYPALTSTIIDFPNVAKVGRGFIEREGLSGRIAYREGNGLEIEWPGGQDVVLLSYLLSSIPGEAIEPVVRTAFAALAPGGRLLVHDFMVDADRAGPKLAALWQLQHTAFNPAARSVSVDWAAQALASAGFEGVEAQPLIPEMTTVVTGLKPS